MCVNVCPAINEQSNETVFNIYRADRRHARLKQTHKHKLLPLGQMLIRALYELAKSLMSNSFIWKV